MSDYSYAIPHSNPIPLRHGLLVHLELFRIITVLLKKMLWPISHTYCIRLTEEGAQRSINTLNKQYLTLLPPLLFSTVKNQNHDQLVLANVFIFSSCCFQKVPNGDHYVTRKGYTVGEVNQRVIHYKKYILHHDLGNHNSTIWISKPILPLKHCGLNACIFLLLLEAQLIF